MKYPNPGEIWLAKSLNNRFTGWRECTIISEVFPISLYKNLFMYNGIYYFAEKHYRMGGPWYIINIAGKSVNLISSIHTLKPINDFDDEEFINFMKSVFTPVDIGELVT